MKTRILHRYIGLVMLLPMIGWAITGVIFFIKPGYDGAYEILTLKRYPIEESIQLPTNKPYEEIKIVQSILGLHLLVKEDGKNQQIDPISHEKIAQPTKENLIKLINDTLSKNSERYGEVETLEGLKATTNTGINVTLDWDRLQFTQRGFDREVINTFYKIHYLQWTPWDGVNQVLGIVGLLFIALLSIFGLRVYLAGRRRR